MRVCRTPNNEKTRSQADKKIIATRFNLFSSPRDCLSQPVFALQIEVAQKRKKVKKQ
jgi:hypothetical protein